MQALDIQHIGQIVKNNIIILFTVLLDNFNLNQSLFFSYMILQSNIKNVTSKGIKIGCHEHLDMNLKRLANKKGMISVEWDRIGSNSTSISKCVRFRVIQLQILHRAYITPCRLKKMDQTLLGLCWPAWLCGSGYPFTLSLVLSGCKISLGRSWRYTR
ncbi:hypothetical protein F7725_002247 [Dissostichus mawsoni]|uniref:Uncharacterized protein n=1 Tax=Dissostichus mawsoni TaxID=36200 RepID=A0A7J5Y1V1_DISMA|nr:hypothetical protein F7725_002234 [Dissostichus mawsoni]KAF3843398.1 hypothetical protein F7725_002247 [Dissostichus mawsoni]